MPDEVRVTPEDLHVSAATVDVHADTLHVRHFEADGRMEAAQAGFLMGSVPARPRTHESTTRRRPTSTAQSKPLVISTLGCSASP